MKLKDLSIRYTYMLAITLAVVPIVCALFGVFYITFRNGLIDSARIASEQTRGTVLDTIRLTENGYEFVSSYYDTLMRNSLAEFRQAYTASGGYPEKIDLASLKENTNGLLDFYIIDADGVIRYATFPTALGIDFRTVPNFFPILTQIRLGDTIEISKVTSELRTHELRKWGYASSPDHQYVLEVGLDAVELGKHIQKMDYVKMEASLKESNPYIAQVLVYDRHYYKLGYEQEETDPNITGIIDQVVANEQDILTMNNFLDIPQSEYIFLDTYNSAMDDSQKVIYLEYDFTPIMARLRWLRIISVLVSTVYMVVALVAFSHMTRTFITRPLIFLSQRVKEIATGNFHVQVPVQNQNEIGQLAASINQMTTQLSQTLVSKKTLEEIINSTGAGLILTDMNFNILEANDYARKFLHWTTGAPVGLPLAEVLAAPLNEKEIQQTLTASAIMEDLENEVLSGDGVMTPVLITFSMFSDSFGTPIGYIALFKDISRTKAELHKLEGLNIRLAREKHDLREKSTHDSLTKVLNREAIFKHLKDMLEDAVLSGQKTAVIMCDIDHFKQVNDEFGHPVGDVVLSEIATVIQQAIRDVDAVGRYGGEEFLVVMCCSDLGEAVQVFDRIRRAVANQPFHDGKVRVTISGGITMDVGDGMDALIARADQYLYQAKHKGRNRGEAGLKNPENEFRG